MNKLTIVVSVLAGFLGGALSGQALPVFADKEIIPGVIKAQKFELVDKNGGTHGALAIQPNGIPRLYLASPDTDNNTAIIPGVIIVSDSKDGDDGKNAMLSSSSLMMIKLEHGKKSGHKLEHALITSRGLTINDDDNRERAFIGINTHGKSFIRLRGKGETGDVLVAEMNNPNSIFLMGKKHSPMFFISFAKGQPFVAIRDKSEKIIWTAP